MLYELAYPALFAGAKYRQLSRRVRARFGGAPADLANLTMRPESCYRTACWWLRKTDVSILMAMAPRRAARLAVERFERTRRLPPRKTRTDQTFEAVETAWRGHRVVMRCYGPEDGPRLLVLHGWNGHVGMMAPLAAALADQGYRVVLPDLPGHGASEGDRFSFYDLADACVDLFAEDDPFAGVVGHSAGGLIAALAIHRGVKTRCLVTIGSPSSLSELLRAYVSITQMPAASLPKIEHYYMQRHGMHPHCIGPSLLAGLPVRTLVIHERSDWQVGKENALALHRFARDSALLMTDGYTHLSILNQPDIHTRVGAFMSATNDGGAAHAC